MAKRFDLEAVGHGYMSVEQMVERKDGDWVRFEDAVVLSDEQVSALLEGARAIDFVVTHWRRRGMPIAAGNSAKDAGILRALAAAAGVTEIDLA